MFIKIDSINESKKNQVLKFIDYDKKNKVIYNNIYFKGCSYVMKIPIGTLNTLNTFENLKIEKFCLSNYVYLLNYE